MHTTVNFLIKNPQPTIALTFLTNDISDMCVLCFKRSDKTNSIEIVLFSITEDEFATIRNPYSSSDLT